VVKRSKIFSVLDVDSKDRQKLPWSIKEMSYCHFKYGGRKSLLKAN
jgi:hypothetical protein